ncbi:MBL fold metallo-hydrolase [Haliea sp. E17]|uniref:MBL fold metallo-hydrolase n=1 Tax=Haliea sp. E17 TaxID=3401576 RepID=UPI003AAD34B8
MLDYPFGRQLPEPGKLLEVASGIYWLRMPLPMALDHINLYLLEDSDGWWVVDTGMSLQPTQELWQEIFANQLQDKPIKAVVCTHWHPDHTGNAGWLCERWNAPLYISRTEYLTGMFYTRSDPEDLSAASEQHQLRLGRRGEDIHAFRKTMGGLRDMVSPLPGSYRRLVDGAVLSINGQRWRVVIGRGHSPEHACLFSDSLNVLISGDQVIPRISSNIAVGPEEPEANPLREWLQSLEHFLDVLPADALVLPAHNVPFTGLHHRLRHLIEHHEDGLLSLEEACVDQPRAALELLPALFQRELNEEQVNMALGECLAHLNYLVQRGQVARHSDEAGVYRYRSVDDTLPLRLRQRKTPRDGRQPLQV